MSTFYVILAIFLFGVLVGIHELGHFLVAKACNVRVEEFSLGMGPAIFKKQRGETLYSLRCVPFGGYCAMVGEDESSDDPRAFTSQAPWKRVLILVAGSFMNFVLGLVIVIILYSGAYAFRSTELVDFREDCPYTGENALQVGDRFYKIDGKRIYQYYNVTEFLPRVTVYTTSLSSATVKRWSFRTFAWCPLSTRVRLAKCTAFTWATTLPPCR